MNKLQDFATEWSLLHRQYQAFENHGLFIKVVAIVIVALAFIFGYAGWGVFGIVLICWLTEAVWKTFQSRTEADLRLLEQTIAQLRQDGVGHVPADICFQVYSRWANEKPSVANLVQHYLAGARVPTVAVTYLLLGGLILLAKLFS